MTAPQKVLVTGATGQLGKALCQHPPAEIELLAVSRSELDLSDVDSISAKVIDWQPSVIINAAAYTAVDKAEEDKSGASTINADAAEALAKAAKTLGARLIHVSTDFVFSGATTGAWATDAATAPINHYGASKLDGEQRIQAVLGDEACIIRTAWVYAPWGQNFLHSMLRLMASRDELGIVADQVGTPTSALGLAQFLWQLARHEKPAGVWHWTDAGVASWYDFSVAIQEIGIQQGLLAMPCQINPITSEQFPTPAKRPGFSVLDKTSTWNHFNTSAPHWRQALQHTMEKL